MVKRTTIPPGRERAGGRAGRAGAGRGGALGPRGQNLFERLFGRVQRNDKKKQSLREARSFAVASGKGGTGKSFLATSLAVVLHQEGKRVSLVDCDFGLACCHLLLGVQPKVHLQHYLTGRAKLDELRLATPSGPTLIPGVTGVRQMTLLSDAALRTFGQGLAHLAATEDVLLFDMGAGISTQNLLTLSSADHVILVVVPELASLTDAYAIVKCVAQLRERPQLSVVVNRILDPSQGQATFDKLVQVARRFTGMNMQYLGAVGEDPSVTLRRIGQQPIVATDPESPTTEAIRAIAHRLAEIAGPLEPCKVDASAGIEARFHEHRSIF